MDLAKLPKLQGKIKSKKRVGRGVGSGKGGHTVGKGAKGQKARTGKKPWLGFEGGQVPLYKRIPRLGGFKRHYAGRAVGISITRFNRYKNGTEISPQLVIDDRLCSLKSLKKHWLKILGNGKLERKLVFSGFDYSSSARKIIEKSGSTIQDQD